MSPSEIVAFAAQKGVSAISITDHDSVDGVEEAIDTGIMLGVEVISGVELSVRYNNSSTHLLGYLFDHSSGVLQQALALLTCSGYAPCEGFGRDRRRSAAIHLDRNR